MNATKSFSAERMADEFLNYLFDEYEGSRHVRRVASWLGMMLLTIERIKDQWWVTRRQLLFERGERRFKVKYNHTLGKRGGIEIIEIGKTPGQPEIRSVAALAKLTDVELLYRAMLIPGRAPALLGAPSSARAVARPTAVTLQGTL
jgi:hypothetical protein